MKENELVMICESARKNIQKALSKSDKYSWRLKANKVPTVNQIMLKAQDIATTDKTYLTKAILEGCFDLMSIEESEKKILLEAMKTDWMG